MWLLMTAAPTTTTMRGRKGREHARLLAVARGERVMWLLMTAAPTTTTMRGRKGRVHARLLAVARGERVVVAGHVHEREQHDDARRHAHAHERGRLEYMRLRVLLLKLADEEVDVERHDRDPHGDVEEEHADPALDARGVLGVVDLVLRGIELRRPKVGEVDRLHGTRVLSGPLE